MKLKDKRDEGPGLNATATCTTRNIERVLLSSWGDVGPITSKTGVRIEDCGFESFGRRGILRFGI